MAEQKNHTLLYVGLAGIAGLLLFEWWKNQQAATTTTITTGTTATDAVTATMAPSGGGTTTVATTPWFFPANATIAQYIKTWMQGLTTSQQANLQAYLASYATQTDISNLYTVINQYFNPGVGLASNPSLNGWWDQFATESGIG